MKRPRSPSLLWTFAGAFFAVLAVAAALQWIVVSAVIAPLRRENQRSLAELVTRRAAARIERLPADAPPFEIRRALMGFQQPDGPQLLVYHGDRGEMVTSHMVPRPARAALVRSIGEWPIREGAGPMAPPPGMRPPDGSPGGGPMFDGPPHGHFGPMGGGASLRFEVLCRDTIPGIDAPRGEVVALLVAGPGQPRSPFEQRHLLFFLPLAIVVAGAAGLLLFRAQVTRLQALEGLATRVASGDLAVRVGDESPDEIGRLARQLDRMTAAMAADRERLERVDQERRRLFADISHELATPLTSIRGFAETLLNPDVSVSDAERSDYMKRMLAESEKLDLLIRDLLDLARLEGGSTPLERTRLDWAALCRNTVDRFEPRFRAEGLSLRWGGPLEEAWVLGDGRRLEQLLDNLLENARRYVPRGGSVEVFLDRAGPDAGAGVGAPGRFRLTVRDDGPGIAPGDLPHVFERFRRGQATGDQSGSGLGLAIVAEIVQRHDGSVAAANREPHGALLTVELPAA
ncbi:MAG TPA: HAMP domain-containing sensor histidine kinase [Candidatus Eisenbacteria bacterium]|nr:HAMP domain-containing sensor histidine kinase [Candidatus Eisenbacteria bacterium]